MLLSSLLLLASFLLNGVHAETNAEGLAFLAKKKAEPGVIETSSGLLYKEIRPGTGKTPTHDSPCSCHYSGTLIDGSKSKCMSMLQYGRRQGHWQASC